MDVLDEVCMHEGSGEYIDLSGVGVEAVVFVSPFGADVVCVRIVQDIITCIIGNLNMGYQSELRTSQYHEI